MRKLLILAGVVLALVAITVLRAHFSGADVQEVDVAEATPRTIRASVLASGTLGYRVQALLTSEIVGKVKAVNVQEGDSVTRGQLVLEIDDALYRADVGQKAAQVTAQQVEIARADNAATQTGRQFDRARALHGDRLVSTQYYDEQRLAYDRDRYALHSAQAQLELARNDLDKSRDGLGKTRILSPLDGVVIAVDIKPGETAIPSVASIAGSELMTIADPGSLHAEVYVDEADIAQLKVGDHADVVITSAPDKPLKGTVQHIATAGRVAPGRQGLSFAVKIAFDAPPAGVLRPGVSCRAEIFVDDRAGVLAVPVEAVLVDESQNAAVRYVFVLRDGHAVRTNVGLGIADDDHQQIVSGLKRGDRVVTGPDTVLRNLRDGDPVSVRAKP
jgi:HlyD family secretion protein